MFKGKHASRVFDAANANDLTLVDTNVHYRRNSPRGSTEKHITFPENVREW
jgi:hypothetical protein